MHLYYQAKRSPHESVMSFSTTTEVFSLKHPYNYPPVLFPIQVTICAAVYSKRLRSDG